MSKRSRKRKQRKYLAALRDSEQERLNKWFQHHVEPKKIPPSEPLPDAPVLGMEDAWMEFYSRPNPSSGGRGMLRMLADVSVITVLLWCLHKSRFHP